MREAAFAVAERAGIAATMEVADGAPSPFESAIAAGSTEPMPSPGLTHDDPWSIIYTSGTTGPSKGVLLTPGQQ